MSNTDSIDEGTKRILLEADNDDSKESVKKEKKVTNQSDDKWESNDRETDDSEW